LCGSIPMMIIDGSCPRRHDGGTVEPVVGTLKFLRPRSRARIEPRHGRTTTGGTL
jgi:hypothetical protein